MMITEIKGVCQFEGCNNPAEFIASGRRAYQKRPNSGCHDVGCYCDEHARIVENENRPEYCDVCPNCGCSFGVN